MICALSEPLPCFGQCAAEKVYVPDFVFDLTLGWKSFHCRLCDDIEKLRVLCCGLFQVECAAQKVCTPIATMDRKCLQTLSRLIFFQPFLTDCAHIHKCG